VKTARNRALAALTALTLAAPRLASAQLLPPAPFGQPTPPPGAPPQTGTPGAPGATGGASGTVAQLQEGESEDSGRRLELVYVNADVGGGFLAGSGGYGFFGFGGAVGVRLLTFTLGARVRDQLGSANLLLVNGEAAYHLVLGSSDVVLGAHGGYAGVTNTGGSGGANAGLDLGFDYYLSSAFSVGASLSPDLYFGGGSARFGLFAGPRAGLHFGL
jgi:hypothetical protein